MALSNGNNQDDFRIPIGMVILLQAVIAAVYIVPIESDPLLSTQVDLRALEPVLFLTPLATYLLFRWNEWVGRWFAVLAPAATIFAMQNWLPIPGSTALLAVSTGIAGGLIGRRAAAAVAAASVIGLLVVRAATAAPDVWQVGLAVISILTTLLIVLSILQSAADLSSWSHSYYQSAVQMMQENRAQQGELQKAIEDLANANRQMTLLYEKQSVLQRIAEDAERAKSSFVAKVSHEFRTPLNMIIGLASVMIENPRMYGRALPSSLLEDLRIIYRNCDHLASLVNDVLALSQLQTDSIVLHRENLNLANVVGDALDVVRPLINKKNLSLTVEMPPELGLISCDRTRIRQVILNLLSNAARFTDQGGITVRVTPQDHEVIIAVSDTGPGISQGDMERIFEPFCQASEQGWRDNGGSGLGLTISKQFVELHNGRIWLESQIGSGTTFNVSLPRTAPLPPTRLPDRWISQEWSAKGHQTASPTSRLPDRPRVVVYDATEDFAPWISSFSDQVELVNSSGFDDAIANAQKTPARAVLLGTHNKLELQAMLQAARQKLLDTPVLGWTLPVRIAPALRAGADSYMVKPINLDGLKQKLCDIPQPVQRVLITDDDIETRQLLARMLALYDPKIIVETAASGQEALDMLQRNSFDLLLLDVMMPDLNGIAVLEQVRANPATRNLPAIMISAQDLNETQPVCEELVVTLGSGIQLNKALECSIVLSDILFKSGGRSYSTPE